MDANLNDVYLRLGQLEGRVGSVEHRIESVGDTAAEMNKKLDGVIAFFEQQKGSRKAVLGLASAAATVFGAAAGALVEYFMGRHG